MRKSETTAERIKSKRIERREYASVLRSLHAPQTRTTDVTSHLENNMNVKKPPFSARAQSTSTSTSSPARPLDARPSPNSTSYIVQKILQYETNFLYIYNLQKPLSNHLTTAPRRRSASHFVVVRRPVVVRTPRRASRRTRTDARPWSLLSIRFDPSRGRDRVGARRHGTGTVSRGRGLLFEIWAIDRSAFVRPFVRRDATRSFDRCSRSRDARRPSASRRDARRRGRGVIFPSRDLNLIRSRTGTNA